MGFLFRIISDGYVGWHWPVSLSGGSFTKSWGVGYAGQTENKESGDGGYG